MTGVENTAESVTKQIKLLPIILTELIKPEQMNLIYRSSSNVMARWGVGWTDTVRV